eukprot:538524-Heterocapsa_arctica.AAC.1
MHRKPRKQIRLVCSGLWSTCFGAEYSDEGKLYVQPHLRFFGAEPSPAARPPGACTEAPLGH